MRMQNLRVALVVASFVTIAAPAHAQFGWAKKIADATVDKTKEIGGAAKDKISGSSKPESGNAEEQKDQTPQTGATSFTIDGSYEHACTAVRAALKKDNPSLATESCTDGQFNTEPKVSGKLFKTENVTKVSLAKQDGGTLVTVVVTERKGKYFMEGTKWEPNTKIDTKLSGTVAHDLRAAIESATTTVARQ